MSDLRPRVLHVLEATLGGTVRYCNDIFEVASNGPFRLAIAYSTLRADKGLDRLLSLVDANGWDSFRVDMTQKISPIDDLRACLKLRRLIREYQPAIVHCHSSKAGALGRLAVVGLARKPPVLYTPNALAVSLGRRYLFIEKLLALLDNRFVAVSEGERKEIAEYRLAPYGRIDLVRPYIDTDFFHPINQGEARVALNLPADEVIIVGVGRLVIQKDPLKFLEIIGKLRSLKIPIRALWLGDGPLRETVESEIQKQGLEDVVHLLGWQPDIRTYLAAADLLLSTSNYESYGYMVAEALAMECPVVATRISGTSDIMVDEFSNFLYAVDDPDTAVQHIQRILAEPVELERLGKAGRVLIQGRFTRERIIESLRNAYTKAINSRQA